MKTILYVGATLMIGASIYGFVDYKKTSHHKEFKKMYDPKEEPVINNDKVKDAVVKGTEKTAVVKKEMISSKKATENSTIKENTVTKTEEPVEKKKISLESFSRARPDKKSIVYEVKADPEKTVQKSTLGKNKEQ